MNYLLNKYPCFLIDYGVHGGCNLSCSYCRSNPTLCIDNHYKSSDIVNKYMQGLTNVTKYVTAVMFKTSGWGEITTLPNFNLLFHHAKDLGYKVLQLITNGTSVFNTALLEKLQKLGYFSLQMSIDGVNDSQNWYRFHGNHKLLERFCANLHLVLRMGIPVEINTVLTDINTASIQPFLDTFSEIHEKYQTPIICVPRGIKVKPHLNTQKLVPNIRMINELEKIIIGSYKTYDSILPPEIYLRMLIDFLRTGHRNWICYDSLVRTNIGSSGEIVIHTTSGKKYLGSIFEADQNNCFAERSRLHCMTGEPDYQLKMNQFDIHFLFLGGKISLDEMSKIPSCSNPVSQMWLQHLRNLVIRASCSS